MIKDENNRATESVFPSMLKRHNRNPGVRGIFVLAGLMVLLTVILSSRGMKSLISMGNKASMKEFGELVTFSGTAFVLRPGQSEWRAVQADERFSDGDLIRTDASGEMCLRYSNGTTVIIPPQTVFAVQRAGNNEIEIVLPTEASGNKRAADMMIPDKADPGVQGGRTALDRATAGKIRPSLSLRRIVQFGRSLEIVGFAEPGSRLLINNESVQVEGDGSFIHFTPPFPQAVDRAELLLTAINVAGRTSTMKAAHDFSAGAGE